jgi:hypothetical protein
MALEIRCPGLIETLSRQLPEGTEEKHENPKKL